MKTGRMSELFEHLRPASKLIMQKAARNLWGPEQIQAELAKAILPQLLKFNSGELAEFCAEIIAEATTRELAKEVLHRLRELLGGLDPENDEN